MQKPISFVQTYHMEHACSKTEAHTLVNLLISAQLPCIVKEYLHSLLTRLLEKHDLLVVVAQ